MEQGDDLEKNHPRGAKGPFQALHELGQTYRLAAWEGLAAGAMMMGLCNGKSMANAGEITAFLGFSMDCSEKV